MHTLQFLFLIVWVSACAHLAPDDSKQELSIPLSDEAKPKAIISKDVSGQTSYERDQRSYLVEWGGCKTEHAKHSVLLMHDQQQGFDSKKFCQGGVAQAFMSSGYDVIMVNRPGFFGSNGPQDFVGAGSRTAIQQGVSSLLKQGFKPIKGIWGYGWGVIAAANTSRNIKNVEWLLLGGGLYDLDALEREHPNELGAKDIRSLRESLGEAGIEERSIAYDVRSLPDKILIYHSSADEMFPVAQSQAFRDVLQSNGYRVRLKILEGLKHEIPDLQHRRIIETILNEGPSQ